MAKIYYSGLVNRIAGRVSHSVLSFWKGIGVIKRHNAGPHQPRTEKQQAIRGMLSTLAGEFYVLGTAEKELWDSWVAMTDQPMSGINAYIKFNMILQKYTPGVSRMDSPPATPDTPEHPEGFSVTAIINEDFCVEWTAPTSADFVMISDIWAMPGLDAVTHPRWTFGASAGADALELTVATTYPVGTVCKFRVRTLDSSGRVSPWSHTLSATAIA